jgi:hypothetical protein
MDEGEDELPSERVRATRRQVDQVTSCTEYNTIRNDRPGCGLNALVRSPVSGIRCTSQGHAKPPRGAAPLLGGGGAAAPESRD